MKMEITWIALTVALCLPVFIVWCAAVALLVRPFRIRVPAFIWSKDYTKALQQLNRVQYMVFSGALVWAAGSQLLATLARNVERWFKLDHPFRETPGYFGFSLIGVILVAIFWGRSMRRPSSGEYDPFSNRLSITKPRS
jgi:hypothetical protein